MKGNLQSGANAVTDRRFIVPMAVSQALEDASKKIYSDGGFKDGTRVMIESFNVEFYNRQDSFPIRMNNISFYRSGDSAHYEHFIFPNGTIINTLIQCEAYLNVPIGSRMALRPNA